MEFDDYRDADDACYEMNGRDLLGDRVTVEIARGTPHGRDREKWGSGSGGNGGGRDRRDGGNIIILKIIYSQKATKILRNLHLFLTNTSFVAFSEYMNFIKSVIECLYLMILTTVHTVKS